MREKRYVNFHKHTHYSNLRSLDCIVKPEQYMKRMKELGHKTYVTTEHGYVGNIFEANTLCNEYGFNMVVAVEAYFVKDRKEKDRSNYHIVLIAKNDDGRKSINKVMSEANTNGYYYKPRIDEELLLSLSPENVMITTACTAGILRLEDAEEYLIKLKEHFKNSLFLEVQCHSHINQKEHNKKIINLSNKLDIPLIHGNDSHYILPEDSKYRDLFLKAKGINYPEENGYILDYPEYKTIVKRYKEQGILNEEQIYKALENTLIIENFTHNLNKDIKLPKVSENSNKKLKTIIMKKWEEERVNIPRKRQKEYIDAIKYELDIIEKTGMEEYFVLDYEIVKLAQEKYDGVITKTGRGCFTEDALVHTDKTIKSIKDVKIGDKVITKDGKFERVYNTMKYDIDEEMVQIKHLYGTDKNYPTICTLDHKIFINRQGENLWVQAKDLKNTDYVCVPKVTVKDNEIKRIDLNDYNVFGFEYDEEYIYEKFNGVKYKYSPSDVAKKIGVGKSIIENFADINCNKKLFTRKPEKLKELMEYIPFETREDYCEFVKKNHTKKINRFMEVDFTFNKFIGLMYGDGFTLDRRKTGYPSSVGLAINSETIKDTINRECFEEISNRLGLGVVENKSKTKKLNQLYINSKVFGNFVSKEIFLSEFKKEKQFNPKWFNQCKENLSGILEGLFLSDGSYTPNEKRISFDNTSRSIINAYKIISLIVGVGVNSLNVRPARVDARNFDSKESFKLRINPKSESVQKKKERTFEDENFWYLPIKEIKILPKMKTTVYDISVENEQSYLLNNMVVHNSAPSFYITKLLGLTNIDRLDSPITLYPTRFMSVERILGTKSLPDIDLNSADRVPLIKASQDILGKDGCHWLISYKPMQNSSAFRLWCKSQGMMIEEYNEVAKNLDNYKNDGYWNKIIADSEVFLGVIESVSPSPCSFLLLDKPISEEVGLMKVGDEICCNLDGYNCDAYKYLKNDYLSVTVWDIIAKTCELAGIEIPSINELNSLLDEKTFKMYELGLTATLNQADSDFATGFLKRYKPKTLGEMSAFVASIRPGFASLVENFIERRTYTTGVDALDEILKDSYHYLMYQESIMKYLVWLGIPESQTYDIIKKIAKKKFKEDELEKLKKELLENWVKVVGFEEGFKETWQVIEDASKYSFNASHSLSYAYDSLYGAYLKSHYPLEYYTVVLNTYKDDVEKTSNILKELNYFGIKLQDAKFGKSKGEYFMDKENKTIYKGVGSIKFLNSEIGNQLFDIYNNNDFNDFIDVLVELEKTSLNSRQKEILIKLGFFSEFGKSGKLIKIVEQFEKYYTRKTFSKDKFFCYDLLRKYSKVESAKMFKDLDKVGFLKELISDISNEEISFHEKINAEIEYLGSPVSTDKKYTKNDFVVIWSNIKYTPTFIIYRAIDGKKTTVKVDKKFFNEYMIEVGDIIKITTVNRKAKKKIINGKWTDTDEINTFITYQLL